MRMMEAKRKMKTKMSIMRRKRRMERQVETAVEVLMEGRIFADVCGNIMNASLVFQYRIQP